MLINHVISRKVLRWSKFKTVSSLLGCVDHKILIDKINRHLVLILAKEIMIKHIRMRVEKLVKTLKEQESLKQN